MRYDICQSADGMWKVVDSETGQTATLGTLRLDRLQNEDALAAVQMLQSRFQQAVREKQNNSARQQVRTASVTGVRKKRQHCVRRRACLRLLRLRRRLLGRVT